MTLRGTSAHPADAPLTHVWTQTGGPAVPTTPEGDLALSFVAPDVKEPTTLTFTLRAHDGKLLSPASSVPVVVEPETDSLGGGGCGCRTAVPRAPSSLGMLAAVGLLAGLARRRRRAA